MKLRVDASIGLAEYFESESLKNFLARADAEMYKQKPAARTNGKAVRR